MAHLPGRRAELGPLRRAALLAILAGLSVASPAASQVAGPIEGRVSINLQLSMADLADQWVPQASGALLFDAAPWIQVGGVGSVGLDHPEVRGASELRVRFGYGGVRVAVRPAAERLPGLSLTMIAAAGNVDVQEPTIGSTLDSENGGVVEPGVTWVRPLGAHLGLLASASWRFAFEFENLVGVSSSELGGPALGVGLVLGPF